MQQDRTMDTRMEQLWLAYRLNLTVLNDKMMASGAADDQVAALLSPQPPQPPDWFRIYEAEQRILARLPQGDLEAEMVRRFVEADRLAVRSLPDIKKAYDETNDPIQKRALALTLIDDLHFAYTKRAVDREQRRKVSTDLTVLGCYLVAAATLMFVAFSICNIANQASQVIVATMMFGAIGAYFSRLVTFRDNLDKLDYDKLIGDFHISSLVLRLMAGAIGALLIYWMVTGNLLGGNVFPEYKDPGKIQFSLENAQFAKLMVWSVIAGFIERMIPDQLTAINTQTAK